MSLGSFKMPTLQKLKILESVGRKHSICLPGLLDELTLWGTRYFSPLTLSTPVPSNLYFQGLNDALSLHLSLSLSRVRTISLDLAKSRPSGLKGTSLVQSELPRAGASCRCRNAPGQVRGVRTETEGWKALLTWYQGPTPCGCGPMTAVWLSGCFCGFFRYTHAQLGVSDAAALWRGRRQGRLWVSPWSTGRTGPTRWGPECAFQARLRWLQRDKAGAEEGPCLTFLGLL